MYKRYVVEFGTGADLHGMDVTKAAKKALKDAISHCCLCGISEILGINDPAHKMRVEVKVAAPYPEQVRIEELKEMIPFGQPSFEVTAGGLEMNGMHVDVLGEGDQIVLVNAGITVYLEVE